MRLIALLVAAVFAAAAFAGAAEDPQTRFFHALRVVECGDRDNPPDGDGGRAIGPYQIWDVYWADAVEADPSIRSIRYQDCRDRDCAAMVVGAYLRRYAPKAWDAQDWEVLARIHNGGPRGHRKDATIPYWAKVQKAMR